MGVKIHQRDEKGRSPHRKPDSTSANHIRYIVWQIPPKDWQRHLMKRMRLRVYSLQNSRNRPRKPIYPFANPTTIQLLSVKQYDTVQVHQRKHALRTLSKGYTICAPPTIRAFSQSTRNQPTQPTRHSTDLRCCLDDVWACRCFDSIRLGVRLTRSSGAAGPRATQSARPPSALCNEVVVQLQQLLGLQADALECTFQSEAAGRSAATHG